MKIFFEDSGDYSVGLQSNTATLEIDISTENGYEQEDIDYIKKHVAEILQEIWNDGKVTARELEDE